MKSAEKIERLVKKIRFSPDASANKRILEYAETVLEQRIDKAKSNRFELNTWRIIMKSKMTKFAAAAVISMVVLLPLAYGATKIIKHFLIDGVNIVVKDSDKINTEQDARNALLEFGELYREGKAKEVKPGVWVVTLSNGEEFAYSGDNPGLVGLSSGEKNTDKR